MNTPAFPGIFEMRRNTSLPCQHDLIVADPAEGGNYLMKSEITDILTHTDDDVVILDVFNEIGPELDVFGTETIEFIPGSGNHINSMYPEELNPFIYERDEFLSSKLVMLSSMMNAADIIPTNQDRCLLAKICSEQWEKSLMLNISDLIPIMEVTPESSNIQNFAKKLKNYPGLQGESTIHYDRRCSVVRVCDIPMAFAVLEHLLYALYEKFMRSRKHKRTWVYIPHIDALIAKDSDCFVRSFWKRARKFSIVCTGTASKNITISEDNSFLWTMSDCIYLLAPDKRDKDWFDLMDVSLVESSQMTYRIGERAGHI